MTAWHAIVLGVVQGVTEFLPISSKTHLIVVPALLGWRQPDLEFIVWLHLGTLIALVLYFLRTLLGMVRGIFRPRRRERGLLFALVVASIPAIILGLLFEKQFDRLLHHPHGAAIALVATAAILVGAEWLAGTIGRRRTAKPMHRGVRVRDAVGMGLAQCLAFLPGVSRSGTTMGAGLAGGLERPAGAEFSFLMAVVAIAGANVLEVPKMIHRGIGRPEVAGLVASFVTGYLSIWWLLRYLRRHNFLPFAAYCVAMAVLGAVRL